MGEQVWDDWNITITTPGLGRSNEGLVVGVGCVALNMDDIFHEVKVFPAEAKNFAPSHTSEDDNREIKLVHPLQAAEGRNDPCNLVL